MPRLAKVFFATFIVFSLLIVPYASAQEHPSATPQADIAEPDPLVPDSEPDLETPELPPVSDSVEIQLPTSSSDTDGGVEPEPPPDELTDEAASNIMNWQVDLQLNLVDGSPAVGVVFEVQSEDGSLTSGLTDATGFTSLPMRLTPGSYEVVVTESAQYESSRTHVVVSDNDMLQVITVAEKPIKTEESSAAIVTTADVQTGTVVFSANWPTGTTNAYLGIEVYSVERDDWVAGDSIFMSRSLTFELPAGEYSYNVYGGGIYQDIQDVPFSIQPGAATEIVIEPIRMEYGELTGKMVLTGNPIEFGFARVCVVEDSEAQNCAYPGPDGTFHLAREEYGTFTIEMDAIGRYPVQQFQVTITAENPWVYQEFVRDEIGGAKVTFNVDLGDVPDAFIVLQVRSHFNNPHYIAFDQNVAGSGSYSFDFPPGVHRYSYSGMGFRTVSNQEFTVVDGEDLVLNLVPVSSGEYTLNIDVASSDPSAGDSFAGAVACVEYTSPGNNRRPRCITLSADGTGSFGSLPMAGYRIYLQQHGLYLGTYTPNFSLFQDGQTVEYTWQRNAGGTLTVNVELPAGQTDFYLFFEHSNPSVRMSTSILDESAVLTFVVPYGTVTYDYFGLEYGGQWIVGTFVFEESGPASFTIAPAWIDGAVTSVQIINPPAVGELDSAYACLDLWPIWDVTCMDFDASYNAGFGFVPVGTYDLYLLNGGEGYPDQLVKMTVTDSANPVVFEVLWGQGDVPTETPTETATPSETPTETSTPIETPTETATPSETPTETSTPIETPTETVAPSETPTETATPSETPTETVAPSETPTETATPSETPTETPTQTVIPTETPNEPRLVIRIDMPGGASIEGSPWYLYASVASQQPIGAYLSGVVGAGNLIVIDDVPEGEYRLVIHPVGFAPIEVTVGVGAEPTSFVLEVQSDDPILVPTQPGASEGFTGAPANHEQPAQDVSGLPSTGTGPAASYWTPVVLMLAGLALLSIAIPVGFRASSRLNE